MYSVTSDGEDGRSRSPSPLENNNDLPSTPLFEKGRLSKLATKPESPFDSKPRIARTPIHSRRLSAETPLQLHSPTPLPHKFSDVEGSGLGVTGHGLLSTTGRTTEYSLLENGVHNDDDKYRSSSGVSGSFKGRDDVLGLGKVEVVGQGLLRMDKDLKAEDETNHLQYETEESDEGVEDDDGRDEDEDEEDEEDEEEDNEEEEGEEGQIGDEYEEADTGSDSEEGEYPTPLELQEADTSTGTTTTTLTGTSTPTIKSEGSSDSLDRKSVV